MNATFTVWQSVLIKPTITFCLIRAIFKQLINDLVIGIVSSVLFTSLALVSNFFTVSSCLAMILSREKVLWQSFHSNWWWFSLTFPVVSHCFPCWPCPQHSFLGLNLQGCETICMGSFAKFIVKILGTNLSKKPMLLYCVFLLHIISYW